MTTTIGYNGFIVMLPIKQVSKTKWVCAGKEIEYRRVENTYQMLYFYTSGDHTLAFLSLEHAHRDICEIEMLDI